MARSEKTSEEIREFHQRVCEIADSLKRAADIMEKNRVSTLSVHSDDILKRILPSLYDWSIGIEADAKKAVARVNLGITEAEDKSPRGRRRGNP